MHEDTTNDVKFERTQQGALKINLNRLSTLVTDLALDGRAETAAAVAAVTKRYRDALSPLTKRMANSRIDKAASDHYGRDVIVAEARYLARQQAAESAKIAWEDAVAEGAAAESEKALLDAALAEDCRKLCDDYDL
tara:strand:- start:140 stop:547 length:408 start_codon:yes stop_codon:yes gene_type:complete